MRLFGAVVGFIMAVTAFSYIGASVAAGVTVGFTLVLATAVYILVLATAAVVAGFATTPGWRALSFGVAAFGLAALGVLTAASVGGYFLLLAFLPGAGLGVTVYRAPRSAVPALGAALAVPLLLIGFYSLPAVLPPVCPPNATFTAQSGFARHVTTVRCQGGRLVEWSRT